MSLCSRFAVCDWCKKTEPSYLPPTAPPGCYRYPIGWIHYDATGNDTWWTCGPECLAAMKPALAVAYARGDEAFDYALAGARLRWQEAREEA